MNPSDPIDPQIQRALEQPGQPVWKRYARLTVGTSSLRRLVLHETLTGLLGGWPGAVGLALRAFFYPVLFKQLGRGSTIGRNVTLRGTARIRIGKGVSIDDQVVLDARGLNASIDIADGTLISRNTILRARNGQIVIGAGSDIGANCILATDSCLTIGRDVLIAAFCYLAAGGNHVYRDPDQPIIRQGFVSKGGIGVADDVWIGSHTTVLDGVRIAKGAIIGAHSLVNQSIPSLVIAWGQPARPQRERGKAVDQ